MTRRQLIIGLAVSLVSGSCGSDKPSRPHAFGYAQARAVTQVLEKAA